MSLDVKQALLTVRMALANIARSATEPYDQAQLAFASALLRWSEAALDHAVEDLEASNQELRAFFAQAATALDQPGDQSMAARALLGAIPGAQHSLRLSVLQSENDALRSICAKLAALLETASDAGAAELRHSLIEVLERQVRRQMLPPTEGPYRRW
jgi:hypothetical protein